MERAKVFSIDGTALLLKFCMHMVPELKIIFLSVEAFGNSCLIGNNHQEMPLGFCIAAEIKNPINKLAIFNFIDMVLIDANHAVAHSSASPTPA